MRVLENYMHAKRVLEMRLKMRAKHDLESRFLPFDFLVFHCTSLFCDFCFIFQKSCQNKWPTSCLLRSYNWC